MKLATIRSVFFASLGCVVPTAAYAHSFATPYVLPVPFWMYVYGCVATLVVSFAVFTYFLSAPISAPTVQTLELGTTSGTRTAARWALRLLRAGACGQRVRGASYRDEDVSDSTTGDDKPVATVVAHGGLHGHWSVDPVASARAVRLHRRLGIGLLIGGGERYVCLWRSWVLVIATQSRFVK